MSRIKKGNGWLMSKRVMEYKRKMLINMPREKKSRGNESWSLLRVDVEQREPKWLRVSTCSLFSRKTEANMAY